MKKIGIYTLFLLCLIGASCSQNGKEGSDNKELALKEKELELKERELALKEQEAANKTTPTNATAGVQSTQPTSPTSKTVATATSSVPASAQKTVKGSNVVMRASASSSSAKLGSFQNGEVVEVLESKSPQNQDEAIAATEIKLYSDYNGKFITKLNKGKALKVERKEGDLYYVSYQHPEYGKLFTTLPESSIASTANLTWYKVRTSAGKVGWVLSSFVQ